MATTIVTKNSSTAAAVPTAAQLVQGELAVNVADKRLYTEDSVGGIVELGTNPSTLTVAGEITANGGIALGDNDKATFGASDDLEIFHDGTRSLIRDSGTGNLLIRATDLSLQNADGATYASWVSGGAGTFNHNNSPKLATTATGIDVTGTATMDGLTVSGTAGTLATLDRTGSNGVYLALTDNSGSNVFLGNSGGQFQVQTAGASYSSKLTVESNGDISFYEDTGTTPKMVWSASAESLGIGTSSPSQKLHVVDTSNPASDGSVIIEGRRDGGANVLALRARDASAPTVGLPANQGPLMRFQGFNGTDFSDMAYIYASSEAAFTDGDAPSSLSFGTTSDNTETLTERMRISSAGTVKISHADTASEGLRVIQTTAARTSGGSLGLFYDDQVGTTQPTLTVIQNGTGDILRLFDGGTQAVTVKDGGNVLVGTTDTAPGAGNTATGVAIRGGADNRSFFSVASNYVASFNRNSNGPIVEFNQSGAPVGSIGTRASLLKIGTGDVGLLFNSASDAILPENIDGGAGRSDAIDLGVAGAKFKDLYLSGGVYLGGTGAANKLDDYEEGTWTPVAGAGGMTGTSITYTATYTKIGNVVTLFFKAYSATGDIVVPNYQLWSGIPFTATRTGTSTVITEDIDQFARQGYASVGGGSFAVSACGSATGTNSLEASITYEAA